MFIQKKEEVENKVDNQFSYLGSPVSEQESLLGATSEVESTNTY
jgi:hypothetical protein